MPPPRPLDGLVWPLVPNSEKKGDRSTTWANKQAFAAAIGAVDPDLAERVLSERKWRQKYTKYVYRHVEISLKSKDAAVAGSKAGLEWVHNNFEFIRDGRSMKLAEAMSTITSSFETGFVKGRKPRSGIVDLKVCFTCRRKRSVVALLQLWPACATLVYNKYFSFSILVLLYMYVYVCVCIYSTTTVVRYTH